MSEETKKQLIKCPDCGAEVKRLTPHKRFCPANKQPEQTESVITESINHYRITNVQPYIQQPETFDVKKIAAWYDIEGTKISKVPDYIALFESGDGNVLPCVLIGTIEGTFLPAFMIEGFIGMYPIDQEFPKELQPENPEEAVQEETDIQPAQDLEPEQKEPENSLETTPSHPEKERPPSTRKILPPEPEKPEQKGLLSRILSKKKKPGIAPEVRNLIGDAINAGKT